MTGLIVALVSLLTLFIVLIVTKVVRRLILLYKKKKLKALDLYVMFSISSLVLYTIAVLIILVKTGMTPDTLTACFFAFFGGEIVTCALIKIFKLKEPKNNAKDDSDEEIAG